MDYVDYVVGKRMYMNYKVNTPTPEVDKARKANLLRFMDEICNPILDIGEPNFFGEELSNTLNIKTHNTIGDFDFDSWTIDAPPQKYSTVWLFEVIEHLKNPDYFLRNLKKHLNKDCVIYVTYPYRIDVRFWSDIHACEFDPQRFIKLVEEAGYTIEKYEEKIIHRNWKFYFRGIRPLLRLFFYKYRHQYYKLRLK